MGDLKANLLSVRIIVFFVLVSMTFASVSAALNIPTIPSGSGSCCVPYYEGSLEYLPSGTTVSEGENYCISRQAVFLEACYDNGELVDQNIAASGCCCQGSGNLQSSTPSSASSGYVSQLYCDELSNTYVGEQSNCNIACSPGTNFYSVSGIVQNSADNQAPLENIEIVSTGNSATSNADGEFSFEEYFEEGTYSFDVVIPADYPLVCPNDISLTRTINQDDFYIIVDLACEELGEGEEPSCESAWEVLVGSTWVSIDAVSNGGYGECLFYGTDQGWLRYRDIQDANACENPTYIPDRYTSEGCEDLIISSNCDGVYNEGEVCDGNSFLYENTLFQDGLSCAQVYGTGYTGDVNCNDCFFDFSSCQSPCDCSTLEQCSNECQFICEDEPICDTCENALSFISEGAPISGDIFGLYDYIENNNPEGFPNSPVQFSLGTKDVIVDWDYDTSTVCASDLLGFDVMVCREDAGSGSCDTNYDVHVESINGFATTQHTFENVLEADASYCFNVIARTNNGDNAAFEPGNLPCYETGHEMCMTPSQEGRNCIYQDGSEGVEGYGPTECETYNQNDPRVNLKLITESCLASEVCIETNYVPESSSIEESGAMCVRRETCDSCNGMFGLFASYNLPAFDEFGDSAYFCEELLFNVQEPGIKIPGSDSSSIQYAQCYQDESKTLFSFYDECEHITSCYDYASKGTCSSDPCFKFTDVETNGNGVITSINGLGCEWVDYEAEIGVGVCRPVEEENQDCEICDTDSPLGFCGKGVCDLYGNCYQKDSAATYQDQAFPFRDRIDQVPACLHAEEMSCVLYDTLDECLGTSEEGRPLPVVDVVYAQEAIDQGLEGNFLQAQDRIAGTNRQEQTSNDLFGFGDCSWNYQNERCYKNSNNYEATNAIDDCDDPTRASVNCFKDNETPVTTIFLKEAEEGETYPLYGSGEILDIQFSASDDASIPDEIKTYVSFLSQTCIDAGFTPCLEEGQTSCISSSNTSAEIRQAYDANCYIYPQHTLAELTEQIYDLEMLSPTGGVHELIYFSEDKARNLEELQKVSLSIDNSNPTIVIAEITENVLQIYEDVYVTDVTILVDIYEESYCQAYVSNLAIEDSLVNPGIFAFEAAPASAETPFRYELNYPQLDDGLYRIFVECYDDFENRGVAEEEFLLDADVSITPVMPLGDVYSDPTAIDLEINTSFPGTCKFDTLYNTFAQSRFTFSSSTPEDDRYTFTDVYPYEELGSTSGIYRLLLSCEFDTSPVQITESQSGDILVFAIDTLAPSGNLLEYGELFEGSSATWRNSRELQLLCDDEHPQTPLGFNKGCQRIHYCISTSSSLADFNGVNPASACTGPGNEYTIIAQSSEDSAILLSDPISLDLSHEYTFIHYFFEDRGESRSDVFTQSTKIRDTDTSEPIIEIG